MNDLEKFKTKIKKIHKILTLLWTFRACSIGINRFNLNQFWLIWLRCSNRTLFWLFLPFLVETRFGLGRIITRLSPCNAGLRELCQDGGNSWSCCPSSCRFRSYRRRNSIGISDDDELEGLALLFLETERIPASRITGYVEDVVRNMTATMFTRNFRMSRETFHWLQ